jgi:hypothetical protein
LAEGCEEIRSWPSRDKPYLVEMYAFGAVLEGADPRRVVPDPVDERLQLRDDLDAALLHLRQVHGSYWDPDWRREHRGMGRYPEHELWEAVKGYLDLLTAIRPAPQQAGTPAEGCDES